MIPKTATAYCREDISLIENYEHALNDHTQVWECHHRLETDLGLSANDLKAMGLYWKRPASELIFLTKAEHARIHMLLDTNFNFKGKHHTEESKTKIGVASKNRIPWNKGKTTPEETKKKIIENCPNRKSVYQIDKTSGEIIKKWISITEVEKILGLYGTHISACCRGKRKTVGGFIWRYVEEV